MTRRLSIILVLLLLVLSSYATAEDQPGIGAAAPYERILPGTGSENRLSVRVLRLEKGRVVPVQGARVSGWSEEANEASSTQARLLAEGHSDEHGFVQLSWNPDEGRPFHWLVDAPGMAVRTFDPGGDVFLAPGAPYALRVLDPMGVPLKGARVEYYIYGCPHSPSARTGTTDAAGEVVLKGLPDSRHPNEDVRNDWGQFWIIAEGVEPGPYSERSPSRPGAPATLLTRVGASAQGTVRDEAGRPKAGVVVRGVGYPRGPVVTTDAMGRFQILGLSSSGELAFYDPDDPLPDQPNAVVKGVAPGVPIMLTLRAGQPRALGMGEPTEVAAVEVLARPEPGAEPAARDDVPVRLVRLSDGLVVDGETGAEDDGLFKARVPRGRYRVVVGGGFSSVVRATREIDVPAAKPERFVLGNAARLVLHGLDADDPEWVGLLLPVGLEDASESFPTRLHLPPEGPAAIQLDRGGPLILPVGPLEGGVRTATVPKPQAVTVRLRVRSADPQRPLEHAWEPRWADDPGGAEEEGTCDDAGVWTLTTYRRGARELTLGESDFQDQSIRVTLAPDTRFLDVGDVLLHPLRRHTLRVVDSEGTAVPDLSLHWGVRGELGNELQEDDGSFKLELGPRPEPAVLRGEGIYPQPLRLGLDGPEEVRLPTGRLVIHVRGVGGKALEAVVYVDHVKVPGKQGEYSLKGVPEGQHTIIVGAPGYVGALRKVEVRDDKPQPVDFSLTPR